MAELVQAGLEGMLTELEQMQRVELLSSDEVREVVKRRRRFEYKLQKREKKKEDILAYIQYECALLQLIEIRRDKMNYLHKRSEIDFAIAKRVNRLYKILEHRFGASGDLKIWISHLEFLTRMKWKEESSRVVRRLVQTQSHKPQVWAFAARFELERSDDPKEKKDNPDLAFMKIENSRRLLLEGLRHHSDSRDIYRDYFCLELHYVEQINKKNEETETTESLEEMKNGKIAKIVLQKMLEDIPEDQMFESEILSLIFHFPIARVRTNLFEFYLELRGESPQSWDMMGRLQMIDRWTDDGRSLADKVEHCCQMYLNGLEKVKMTEMFDKYVSTLMELMRTVAKSMEEKKYLAVKFLEAFEIGKKFEILSENQTALFKDIIS